MLVLRPTFMATKTAGKEKEKTHGKNVFEEVPSHFMEMPEFNNETVFL